MNDIQKRFLLFILGCISVRLLLVKLAKDIQIKYLPVMGMLALIPAIGFIYIYFSGSRKTGTEVFGNKIWWNNLRPVHGILYILFAYYAINKNEYAWRILLADVLLGLISFLIFHYSEGNFGKLVSYENLNPNV